MVASGIQRRRVQEVGHNLNGGPRMKRKEKRGDGGICMILSCMENRGMNKKERSDLQCIPVSTIK